MGAGPALLVCMSISGAATIPGQWIALDQAYERDAAMCAQLQWMLRRNAQMAKLNRVVAEDIEKYFDPALRIAQTAQRNWEFAKAALRVDKKIMYINAGVLAVVMVVYVALAWMLLARKGSVLKEAFQAVRRLR